MAEPDLEAPPSTPLPGKEETFYLVNRLTDGQTRLQRTSLPRPLRGQRVLHLFGRAFHPARNYLFARSFLLEHRTELEAMEKQGVVGFRRMNLEWVSIREGLPPGVQRKEPPVPFSVIPERPIGDMPVDASVVPPEGGFHREPPQAWVKGTDPGAMEVLQKVLDAGLLRSKPDTSKVLRQKEEFEAAPTAAAPAPPVDAFEEVGPARPSIPAPIFRKRADLVEPVIHDPFADPEE